MYGYTNKFFDNLLINTGDCISQREGEAFTRDLGTGTASRYHFDRWFTGGGANFSTGILRVTDPISGPGFGLSGKQLGRIQRYEVNTAEAAPAASQWKVIEQRIEGSTIAAARAAGKDFLFSTWMNATPGMTLTWSLRSYDSAGSSLISYLMPVTTVSGWQRYPFIIPAPTLQDFRLDTSQSFILTLAIHTGSNFQSATTEQWHAGNFFAVPSQSNFMDTIGNFIELDQTMLLSGPRFSDDFANNIEWMPHAREVGGELRSMQRYYYQTGLGGNIKTTAGNGVPYAAGYGPGGNSISHEIAFPTTMRINPSMFVDTSGTSSGLTDGSSAAFNITRIGFSYRVVPSATVSYTTYLPFTADSEL